MIQISCLTLFILSDPIYSLFIPYLFRAYSLFLYGKTREVWAYDQVFK